MHIRHTIDICFMENSSFYATRQIFLVSTDKSVDINHLLHTSRRLAGQLDPSRLATSSTPAGYSGSIDLRASYVYPKLDRRLPLV